MAEESKSRVEVSSAGAFAIGLFFGAGLMLIFHALDTKNMRFELDRSHQAAEVNRAKLMKARSERELMRELLTARGGKDVSKVSKDE